MRIDNPDELPYYVLEGERPVRVRFAPLEAGDENYINAQWHLSIFFDVWQRLAQYEIAQPTSLKLVAVEKQDDSILGLLRMGDSASIQVTYGKLNTQSLLETAPHLRYQSREREYHGVGKALIARLIAESILRGQGGSLVVSPRPQVIPFYRHLGFQPLRRNPKQFFIRAEAGLLLLQSTLMGDEEK